jgi:outer membrane biosynthesis protein TonB
VSAASRIEHDNRFPALIVAAALHAAVLAAVILIPSRPSMLPIGSSVPINIVSSDKFTDTAPAVEAPQVETAAAPQPTPRAPPQPPAAEPAPPAFSAEPRPEPARPKPAPAQAHAPSPAAAEKPFDFNRLQQIIAKAQKTGGSQASSAQRGPARAETDTHARPNAGHGLSQSDLVGLEQLLERLWNPNCDVPGGASVQLQVKFTVGPTGQLAGRPDVLGGLDRSGDAVVAVAARRAIDAVREAEPYAEPYYGQAITVNFDAKEACSKR